LIEDYYCTSVVSYNRQQLLPSQPQEITSLEIFNHNISLVTFSLKKSFYISFKEEIVFLVRDIASIQLTVCVLDRFFLTKLSKTIFFETNTEFKNSELVNIDEFNEH